MGEDILPALDWLLYQDLPDEVMTIVQDPTMGIDLNCPATNDTSTNKATELLARWMGRSRDSWKPFRQLLLMLIRSGADVNYFGPLTKHTYFLGNALLELNDDGAISQILVEHGADICSSSGVEGSVLSMYLKGSEHSHSCYFHNDEGKMRTKDLSVAEFKLDLLLKHGADPNKKTAKTGKYPLDYAYELMHHHSSMARYRPACMRAETSTASSIYLSLVKKLIEHGANTTNSDQSWIFRTLLAGEYDIARMFIERGGTCFGVRDKMEMLECRKFPQDIRLWFDTVYFL